VSIQRRAVWGIGTAPGDRPDELHDRSAVVAYRFGVFQPQAV
jgi:hypothetical protein